MGWGSSFEAVTGKAIAERQKQAIDPMNELIQEVGEVLINLMPKVYLNVPPTHDPYANPNAHIYYECKCGAILDPKTKSFAALNNCASEKGWKVRFGHDGYVPYCVECGEGVD